MTRSRALAGLLGAALGAVPAGAQTTRVVPPTYPRNDANTGLLFPFGSTASRSQQIWDGPVLATTSATLNGMAMRAVL